ncbi:hypothetical protein IP70_01590 [alpha proteobacterium AAP38]|nr:hypothetical protein IP70_01590 [alpha proteobacterium AAP38]
MPKIVNPVFVRRVFSRILYEQMIGRATRLCTEIGRVEYCIFYAVGLYAQMQAVGAVGPVVVNPASSIWAVVGRTDRNRGPAAPRQPALNRTAGQARRTVITYLGTVQAMAAASQGHRITCWPLSLS